ncbi:MAG: sulfotransferase [Bacteroidales bacterium]|nr:sulfotransferase [Bacteroidales bacterium]MCF8404527.1 sulfotransferase [Bacteroidales bacterium]
MEKVIGSIKEIPIFFIIGRPRSGTTLLQTLFEAHPNVAIPPEAPVIVECYERFKENGAWEFENLGQWVDFLNSIRKFDAWKIDVAKLVNAFQNQKSTLTFQDIIRLIYLQYESPFDKFDVQIIGDKNPRYSRYPELLIQLFPDAKFIHVVRDYRDHILSMQKVGLLGSDINLISTIWRKSQKKMLKFQKDYPKQVYSCKYEDFVEKPQEYFKSMCEFLEIPFDAGVFDFHQLKQEYDQKFPKKTESVFHSNLFRPINTSAVGKWQKKMTEKDVARADLIVGKYAELSGYERDKKSSFRNYLGFLPYRIKLGLYFLVVFSIKLVPIKVRKMINKRFVKFSGFVKKQIHAGG